MAVYKESHMRTLLKGTMKEDLNIKKDLTKHQSLCSAEIVQSAMLMSLGNLLWMVLFEHAFLALCRSLLVTFQIKITS